MNAKTQAPVNRPVRRRRRLYETSSSTPVSSESSIIETHKPAKKIRSTSAPMAESGLTDNSSVEEGTIKEEAQADIARTKAKASLPSRIQEAENIVRDHVWWSMTFGLIPVPLLDFVAITGVQLKMIQRLCDYYQQAFSEQQAQAIIAAMVGGGNAGFIGVGLSRTLGKFIPLVGFVSMPIAAGALTYAVGRVFIHHFELGGTFLSFDVEKMREYFAQEQKNGQKIVENVIKK